MIEVKSIIQKIRELVRHGLWLILVIIAVVHDAKENIQTEWAKVPEEERKEAEQKMMKEWQIWYAENEGSLNASFGAGKTKLVTKESVGDTRNELMCVDIIEGESGEEIGEKVKNHPHFGIPDATIEITELREMNL